MLGQTVRYLVGSVVASFWQTLWDWAVDLVIRFLMFEAAEAVAGRRFERPVKEEEEALVTGYVFFVEFVESSSEEDAGFGTYALFHVPILKANTLL